MYFKDDYHLHHHKSPAPQYHIYRMSLYMNPQNVMSHQENKLKENEYDGYTYIFTNRMKKN